jgi:putative acetyltransferase
MTRIKQSCAAKGLDRHGLDTDPGQETWTARGRAMDADGVFLSARLAERFQAPFSGPSFMALELVPGALAGVTGQVRYPPPFGLESARP